MFLEWGFLKIRGCEFVAVVLLDWVRLLFLRVVCLISSSIFNYCKYYIEGEVNFIRFSLVIRLFVLSIVVLILSPNLIRILLGWDGLGLSSYILVIFYQNESSSNAGILTVLRNRVGDVALLIAAGLILSKGS